MNSVYLISLIVGGFFVLLSIFGGADSDSDVDVDHDFDLGADADHDFDLSADADHDFDVHVDVAHDADISSGVGFVDLLSVRALFLFAAFFGLTGVLLNLFGTAEPLAAILSVATGLVVGLGGNWLIKQVGYKHVSSDLTPKELRGRTAQVLLPFEGTQKGKIVVTAKGQSRQMIARSLNDENEESYNQGEDVVIVRIDGSVAEVVKPN